MFNAACRDEGAVRNAIAAPIPTDMRLWWRYGLPNPRGDMWRRWRGIITPRPSRSPKSPRQHGTGGRRQSGHSRRAGQASHERHGDVYRVHYANNAGDSIEGPRILRLTADAAALERHPWGQPAGRRVLALHLPVSPSVHDDRLVAHKVETREARGDGYGQASGHQIRADRTGTVEAESFTTK